MIDCKLRITRSEFRRSFRQLVIAFAVIAAGAIPSFAGETTPTYPQALDALYNLDFNNAELAFNSLVAEDPPNPDYWNGLASTIWMKILYDQRKFNIDSYSGSSIGTTRSHDSVNPDDEKRLRDAIGIAMTRANAMLTQNPKDVRALYAIGVSNGTLAAFEGISKRSYLTALSRAKAARKYHEQVLNIDPNFNDALLSIGTYDYGASVIPLPFRFALLGLFGASGGGKDEGIRKLEVVASSGRVAATDAKMILIAIYNRERQYDQSLRLIDELLARYPRNFQFEMDRAAVYGKMKNWPQAVGAYQHILSKVQAKQDGYDRLRAERVYAQIGNANVKQLKLDEAIAAFNEIVGSGKAGDDEKADAHLRIGKIYDSRSERAKAIKEYDAILKLTCSKQYQNNAKGYLSKPFKE
jgi:tetratricopeptide (TPR) repeat protein